MTENEWKQRFTAELARLEVTVQPELISPVAYQFWLSSCGVDPEAIAVAAAEAWPERRVVPADSLVTTARQQVKETRELLHRLSAKQDAYELQLLHSRAAIWRDYCSATWRPDDGAVALGSSQPESSAWY